MRPTNIDSRGLSAVIIHFGDVRSTERFAHETVERNRGVRFFLVNNGPDSDEVLKGVVPPEVSVIGPPVNRGYAAAANLGIETAVRLGHDDIVILPDDGEVPVGALAALRDEAREHGATVTGPLVLYQGGNTIWAAGHWFSKKWGISRNIDKGKEWSGESTSIEIEYITGHAPLLRGISTRPWLRFDEDLFIYYEDISICDEVKRRGETTLLARSVVVYHDKPGQASYRFGATQEKHMARSGLVYWAKHTSGIQRATYLLGFVALTCYRLSRAASWDAALAGGLGLWRGSLDAWRILRGRSPAPVGL